MAVQAWDLLHGAPSTAVSLCLLITWVNREISGDHKMRILHGLEAYGDSKPTTRNPEEKA